MTTQLKNPTTPDADTGLSQAVPPRADAGPSQAVPPRADAEPSQAAEVWLRLAREPGSDFEPAVAWAEYGRCRLSQQRLVEAEAALNRALEIKPGYMLPRKLLGWVAAERQDWPSVLEQWHIVLASYLNPAELVEALHAVGSAYIFLGMFDEAEGVIKKLASDADDTDDITTNGNTNNADDITTDGNTNNNADDITNNAHNTADNTTHNTSATAAGQRASLELRKALARERLDGTAAREAWREYKDRFPDAVAESTADWFALTSSRDSKDGKHYLSTPDDLSRAPDASTAARVLNYLGRRPRGEYHDLHRQALEAFPAETSPQAKALHIDFIRILSCELASKAELEELKARAAAFQDPLEDWRTTAAVGVVAEDHAAVAEVVQAAASRLGPHAELDRLQLWLAAAAGDHDEAYSIARRTHRNRHVFGEDGRGLDLRLMNNPPREKGRRQDRILLFANVKNERLFLPWFLDYYRSIGVEWFFIIDNQSNDGTAEYLAAQKDVTLFSSADDYAVAVCGIRWTNELIRRYGQHNWCVCVDTDEQLLLPDHENSAAPLRAAVDGMAARGEEVMRTYMLDTYPQDMAALKGFQAGDEPVAVSSLIDPDYFFSGNADCCFFRVSGGVRNRLFGTREKIDKASILRGGSESSGDGDGADHEFPRLYRSIHNINYGRVSSQCAVLLHHKLLREALELLQANPDRRLENHLAHYRLRHQDYRHSGLLDTGARIPRTPHTVTFKDSAQLQKLGLLGDFAAMKAMQ